MSKPVIHYAPYGPNAVGCFDCGAKASDADTFTGYPGYVTCDGCKRESPGLWPEYGYVTDAASNGATIDLATILAAKKQMERITDSHLRTLALHMVGTPVILDKDQREDVVFKVNQRTWDALQDLKSSVPA